MRATRLRIDHLAFPSFDAGETYRFYTEVMGFRLKFAAAGKSKAWGNKKYLMTGFAHGTTEVHFFALAGMARPKSDGLPKDIRHIAFAVRSRTEVATWKQRLERHSVPYWVEEHDGVPSVYFSDPNGVMFEINCHRQEAFDRRSAAAAHDVVRHWAEMQGQRSIP